MSIIKIYLKTILFWIITYWWINFSILAYYKTFTEVKFIDNLKGSDNFFIATTILWVGTVGISLLVGMEWLGLYPDADFSSAISISEIPNLSLNEDLIIDDLDLQEQKKLEAQKEAREMKHKNAIWVITTLVVFYIVFRKY